MLPLILGIGAAALLLGRKAVKRAGTRSNPRKRKAVKRTKRNPRNRWGDYIREGVRVNVTGARGGGYSGVVQSVETRGSLAREYGAQATVLLDNGGVIKASIHDCSLPGKTRANPARRRKGKWTSPGSAAARLAWWRWHHNPKRKMTGGEARAFFDALYAREQSEREAYGRTPKGEAERQARNQATLLRMRAARKSNPRRRRKSRRK